MKIEVLEEFVVLAKALNFHVSSEALYISQPTLSKHIKDLESELGVQLFTRDSKGVALTETGEVIAQKAAFLLEAYRDLLSSARKGRRGRLEVAVPLRYTMFSELIAVARDSFMKENFGVDCLVRDFSLDEEPVELLSAGCDLVLNVYLPEYEGAGVKARRLCSAKLAVWAAQEGRLAGRDAVSIDDLNGMVFRPASGRESYPWLDFVAGVFRDRGASFAKGEVLDDQYRLGPVDFGLVFGSEPTAMLGFNARKIPLSEDVLVDVAAYYRASDETPALRDLVDVLTEQAVVSFETAPGEKR